MATNIKNQVKEILNRTLTVNSVDEHVSYNMSNDLVTKKFNACYEDLNKLFNTLSQISANSQPHQPTQAQTNGDSNDLEHLRRDAMLELVNNFFEQKHPKKQLILLRVISKLAQTRSIEVRYICEYMLNNLLYNNSFNNTSLLTNTQNSSILSASNNFTNSNLFSNTASPSKNISNKTTPYIWCKVLEFIRRLIPNLDYKACRDIFKMLLDVIKKIPHSNSNLPLPLENEMSFTKAINKHRHDNDFDAMVKSNKEKLLITSQVTNDIKLESLYETISLLLDQENYFMPRYLAINEIKSVLTFGKEPYHPRFHYMFSTFIESFIPTAHLISISGREKLLPIVGCSNLYSSYSFWRFNPSTCKFNTSGPLPYFKHVSKPHHDVFFYLLRQNAPQYLLMSLMSVHRNVKSRFPLFEDEFSSVLLDTMIMTESMPNRDFENLRIWNNLVNQLVNLNQNLHLPALIHHLCTKLKNKGDNFKESRDWLMWFLLLILIYYNNKSFIPEFTDLYDVLYKDDEVLPNPDLNSFISVVKLAPLSIWIHLNWKSISFQNQDAAAAAGGTAPAPSVSIKSKSLIPPELVKNHVHLLQECLSSSHCNDFGLSICMNAYSIETSLFSASFNNLLEKIGKSVLQQTANMNVSTNIGSPNSLGANSAFTNHHPVSFELIASFTLHVRMLGANYLTCILIQKPQLFKVLTLNIPAAIVETFARIITYDPDNFIKYFTQNLWAVLTTTQPNNLPPPIQAFQQQQPHVSHPIQLTFLHQQLNLLVEMIAFRLKNLSFTHRTTFLYLLNSLFAQPPPQQQPPPISYIKHPLIYLNVQCAMIKLLLSFTGSDHYELLNSVLAATKHGPKYFINPDEEINKAIVIVIARAIHLTSSDLSPLENKDKEDSLKNLFRDIMKITPIYFPDYMIQHFPKVMHDFFANEQAQLRNERIYIDSSSITYKTELKRKVDDDYKSFLETRPEMLNQFNFQNQNPAFPVNTLICVMFRFLQDESIQPQNFRIYLSSFLNYLNGLDNKKMTQSIRTFCDYLIIESANKPKQILHNFASVIIRLIREFNIFTYDRFLFIMTFRSFDANDCQLSLEILHIIYYQNDDFINKYKDYMAIWNNKESNDEWNPLCYYNYIVKHPEHFFNEGLKEQLNIQSNDIQIITYYGSTVLRCVPVLDFLNNRYIELNSQSNESDSLLDQLNSLYCFSSNPISYVYNSLVYYNNHFETLRANSNDVMNKSKKQRLLFIIANRYMNQLSQTLQNRILNSSNHPITLDYYYYLIKHLVNRMLDLQPLEDFNSLKSEFQNPSCHTLYLTLCEILFMEVFESNPISFSRNVCQDLIEVFFKCRFERSFIMENKHFAYWINASGLLIANLPESYWHPIYERIVHVMLNHPALNTSSEPSSETYLLDSFDIYLADEKNCFNEVSLIIGLFHSIWVHSNANHFQYFVKFLKERRTQLIKTEAHFLFICKLIGPFLSKIHVENTNLLISLVEELYDIIYLVDQSNEKLYHMETICNFFYHLKYRHIGESIKEKIHTLMPHFRPELKKYFKYITSELNQQLQQQQQQQLQKSVQNSPPLLGSAASKLRIN